MLFHVPPCNKLPTEELRITTTRSGGAARRGGFRKAFGAVVNVVAHTTGSGTRFPRDGGACARSFATLKRPRNILSETRSTLCGASAAPIGGAPDVRINPS